MDFLPRFYWPLLLFSGRFPFCTCSAHNSAPALLPKLPPGERGRNISSSLFLRVCPSGSLSMNRREGRRVREHGQSKKWRETQKSDRIQVPSSECAEEKKTFSLPSPPPFAISSIANSATQNAAEGRRALTLMAVVKGGEKSKTNSRKRRETKHSPETRGRCSTWK